MANKSDFDKIDTNKDGVISEEEYANATKSAGVEKDKLNWFLRLFTLGDRFDIKDFFDRFKKSILEFIILVFGVTVSFGIEQQGGESDNRNDGIENLNNLREEIDKMIVYTTACCPGDSGTISFTSTTIARVQASLNETITQETRKNS